MYVSDQDASLDFYVNKLGFEKKIDEEMWPGARWLEVVPPKGKRRLSFRAPQRSISSRGRALI
jgi:lactoylglutathione lyase